MSVTTFLTNAVEGRDLIPYLERVDYGTFDDGICAAITFQTDLDLGDIQGATFLENFFDGKTFLGIKIQDVPEEFAPTSLTSVTYENGNIDFTIGSAAGSIQVSLPIIELGQTVDFSA